ncbi:MAG TPA: ROK family protein [Planctomycetota bacterium]|nr:ROK family protein [Planctomycetota bacterium]
MLAADLGGTKCRFALVTEDLRVLGARRVATVRDQGEFLARMEEALTALAAERYPGVDPPAALGIGTAGVVARDEGCIRYAPNLPLDGFPLATHMQRVLGLPTTVLNDGRASAIGEYSYGYAAGADPLLVLFFGTGVGVGLIVNGRPYEGADNAAGEIGHTVHRPGGRIGPNGLPGSFEAYCGGGPITARAWEEIGPPPDGAEAWDLGRLVAAAETDPRAARILEEAEVAATALVANACTLLNPRAVVLGGGVLRGWPALRGAIERFTMRWCSAAVTRNLRFVPSRGESDAILWGAAEATGALRGAGPASSP